MSPAPTRRLVLLLATGFGAGRVSFAPGTAGSLVGLALALALATTPLGMPAIAAITAIVCIVGFPICASAARTLGESDPRTVVWDEIAGVMVALVAAPAAWHWWAAAFVLFRAFDVLKPWPIRWIDRSVPGGAGIMLDDLAAGALAGAAVQVLARLTPGTG